MAPEIVKKVDYEAKGTDVWAIGVLLYRMLYGDPPFKAPSEKELYQRILKGDFDFPTKIPSSKLSSYEGGEDDLPDFKVSESVKDLIKKMLIYNPADRATIDQVEQHEWFQVEEEAD